MTRLIFPESELEELRAALLAASPNEAGAVILANRAGERALLVDDVSVVPPEYATVQGPDRLEIDPRFLAPRLKRAREHAQSVILVHTHPFSDWPRFSQVDDAGEAALIPSLYARAPLGPHGALVLGTRGFAGRLHGADGGISAIDVISEVGSVVRRHAALPGAPSADEIYDRNVRAFGAAGQRLLRELTVGIVGLGGTGSIVAQQLAHLGVGALLLIDDDVLEQTNLNRVVGASAGQVGQPKVAVAKSHIERIAGGRVRTEALVGSILDEADGMRLIDCDLVLSCTDTHGSRAVLNQIAYQFLVPTIDIGVQIDAADGRVRGAAGRVQMLAPGLACLQCHELLDPLQVRRDLQSEAERRADRYIVGEAEPQPSVITLNSVVSSLASTMFLAATVGFPGASRHQNYLIASGMVRSVSGRQDPDCIVCSRSAGAFARGSTWPMFWRQS